MGTEMPTRKKEPLQYASGYSLDLYCDSDLPYWEHDHIGQFNAQTFGQCAKEARQSGWKIHKDRTATCPLCARKTN